MKSQYPAVSIAIACMLHLIWAVTLVFNPEVHFVTGIHTVQNALGSNLRAAELFVVVALLASTGLMLRNRVWRVLLILPQQVLLWFSVVGISYAMYLGQYADGTLRNSWFLIADQVPVILITLGHMAALRHIGKGKAFG